MPLKIDPLLVLEMLQAEEHYREVKKRLALHVMQAHGLDEGQEVRLKHQDGVWVIGHATIGVNARRKNQDGPELVIRFAVKPRGATNNLYTYATLGDMVLL